MHPEIENVAIGFIAQRLHQADFFYLSVLIIDKGCESYILKQPF